MKAELRDKIRSAFRSGELRVEAVDPKTGEVGLHSVKDVMKHFTGDRPSHRVRLESGAEVITTCDHSLFRPQGKGISAIRADDLHVGETAATVKSGALSSQVILESEPGAPLEVSYDLCVPGPENFVLSNGVVAHNSYSIGGISLDLERSSKYMDLKRNAEEQFVKLTESKQRTEKYLRGLSQPRFGRGVRSAFGPHVGRGVLSPRGFLAVLLVPFAGNAVSSMLEAIQHASILSPLLA
jgi:hypothetical protein